MNERRVTPPSYPVRNAVGASRAGEVIADVVEHVSGLVGEAGHGKHDGKEFTHRFTIADSNGSDLEGSETFFAIRNATGILSPNDTADFHGAVLTIISKGGRIKYEPAASSDFG